MERERGVTTVPGVLAWRPRGMPRTRRGPARPTRQVWLPWKRELRAAASAQPWCSRVDLRPARVSNIISNIYGCCPANPGPHSHTRPPPLQQTYYWAEPTAACAGCSTCLSGWAGQTAATLAAGCERSMHGTATARTRLGARRARWVGWRALRQAPLPLESSSQSLQRRHHAI